MPTDTLRQVLGLGAPPALALAESEQQYLHGFLLGLGAAAPVGVPILPATAPLAPARRLFVDGLLAGMYSRSEAPAIVQKPSHLVLWASQTGNSQTLAERCASHLREAGLSVHLDCMDAAKPAQVGEAASLLLITSTFGDGEAPDSATTFWRALQDDAAWAKRPYAVLALGDSSYDQFCGFGRKLDQRLTELGGERLLERVDCEPDFDEPFASWLQALTAKLAEAPVPVAEVVKPAFGKNYPLPAQMLENRVLNGPGASKETRQIVFDLGDSGLAYEAGDALGIWPRNCPQLVEEFLRFSGLDGEAVVNLKESMPLAVALGEHLDISRITPQVLAKVSGLPGDKAALNDWLWGRQLVDLLAEFPLNLSQAEWLALLKPLQPRLYSISSSPKLHPTQVHLTMSTVRFGQRKGVCSSYLADRTENLKVQIFPQPSASFRLPVDDDVPVIMIGPGTGIAPFRAFLQEREARQAKGRNWLFFGEQREACDFYYRDELMAWRDSGVLTRLDTAFSRDQEEKIYVQQRMREQGALLWQWLEEGACFYVCGDGARMAKDVDAALKEVIAGQGGMSAEDAALYVAQMGRDKRYLRDVY